MAGQLASGGAVASRSLGRYASGELSMGSMSSLATGMQANGLSVSGQMVTYWSTDRAGLAARTLSGTSYPVSALE